MLKPKSEQIKIKPEQIKTKTTSKTSLKSEPLAESIIQAERIGTWEVKWSKRRHAWVKQIIVDDPSNSGVASNESNDL